uniref:Transmembrane protein n=1 Tax=Medicago truncatula TaxID=3880 RepID=I3S3V4_MEDTR|nr:unknown [Medicago truncatula]
MKVGKHKKGVELCWVFVLAALLLKQISLFVLLEPMFQHMCRHLCKMLDTMFQHPGTV